MTNTTIQKRKNQYAPYPIQIHQEPKEQLKKIRLIYYYKNKSIISAKHCDFFLFIDGTKRVGRKSRLQEMCHDD